MLTVVLALGLQPPSQEVGQEPPGWVRSYGPDQHSALRLVPTSKALVTTSKALVTTSDALVSNSSLWTLTGLRLQLFSWRGSVAVGCCSTGNGQTR